MIKKALISLMPKPDWIVKFSTTNLSSDLIAGSVTTSLLVPQAIAFTFLAGLRRIADAALALDVTINLSDVKGSVMDKFDKGNQPELIVHGNVYLSAHQAADALKDNF